MKEASEEYWKSNAGLLRRADMLARAFTVKVVNGAYKVYGQTAGVKWVVWRNNPGLSKTGPCTICEPRNGRRWRITWFTPAMPAHPSCVCDWEFEYTEEEINQVLVPGKEYDQYYDREVTKYYAEEKEWRADLTEIRKGAIEITWFETKPGLRGQGLGRKNYKILENEIKKLEKYETIYLTAKFPAVEGFWKKMGFEQLGDSSRFYKDI